MVLIPRFIIGQGWVTSLTTLSEAKTITFKGCELFIRPPIKKKAFEKNIYPTNDIWYDSKFWHIMDRYPHPRDGSKKKN
jgi:hypothetical protein